MFGYETTSRKNARIGIIIMAVTFFTLLGLIIKKLSFKILLKASTLLKLIDSVIPDASVFCAYFLNLVIIFQSSVSMIDLQAGRDNLFLELVKIFLVERNFYESFMTQVFLPSQPAAIDRNLLAVR
jgi:hypothetical protein